MDGTLSFRSVVGVALLVSCFVFAFSMRSKQFEDRWGKKLAEQPSDDYSNLQVNPTPSGVLAMRIARQGRSAMTFRRDRAGGDWEMDGVDFKISQVVVNGLVEEFQRRCVRGEDIDSTRAEDRVIAEVLVGAWRVSMRQVEGEDLYWLERGGRRCVVGGEQIFFGEDIARVLVPIRVQEFASSHSI